MVKKALIVNAYQVNLYCDKCGKRMIHNGPVLLTNSPKYKYVCECGETALSEKLYPYQIVEFDEGNAEIINEIDEDVPVPEQNEPFQREFVSAEKLGKRIASLMDEYDLDIKELSDNIGIKEDDLKQVIAGERFLSFEQISALAELLRTKVLSLLTK